MSDEYAKQVEGEKSVQPEETTNKSFSIMLTLQPNGELEITGPIGNDVLCYGMLEKARSHIQNIHLSKSVQKSQVKKNGNGAFGGILNRRIM